ncbi:unnamed protein product [Moneuplotes crassus]|uniref:Uncharacterized protein n=1 Tax=Euplotes crassus TaxID=5936 RepID=A0AAD1UR88_EUPCR|nr:unnamed protein product [Moneuplotes crassus]
MNKNLKNNLKCQICHEVIFKARPRSCPECSRTWCEGCIFQWLQNNKKCPNCNKRLTTSNLVLNYMIVPILELVEIKQEAEDSCSQCKKSPISFCVECEKYICMSCLSVGIHSGHKLLTKVKGRKLYQKLKLDESIILCEVLQDEKKRRKKFIEKFYKSIPYDDKDLTEKVIAEIRTFLENMREIKEDQITKELSTLDKTYQKLMDGDTKCSKETDKLINSCDKLFRESQTSELSEEYYKFFDRLKKLSGIRYVLDQTDVKRFCVCQSTEKFILEDKNTPTLYLTMQKSAECKIGLFVDFKCDSCKPVLLRIRLLDDKEQVVVDSFKQWPKVKTSSYYSVVNKDLRYLKYLQKRFKRQRKMVFLTEVYEFDDNDPAHQVKQQLVEKISKIIYSM